MNYPSRKVYIIIAAIMAAALIYLSMCMMMASLTSQLTTAAQWSDNPFEFLVANFTGELEAKIKAYIQQHDLMYGVDPVATMETCQIAHYHGFNCEEYLHEVVTDDGYMLTLHRINGREGENIKGAVRPPVFVQHGLLCDSSSWVLNLVNQSIPFILSDAGFDVWLGNSRGNTYSKMHKTLSPKQEEFWDWSWVEMGELDLPKSIDFVLEKTGYDDLHYVAHSQGTLIAFTHMAANPTTHKISHMLALGPVVTVATMESPLKYMAPFSRQIDFIASVLGWKDFLPSDMLIRWLARNVCSKTDLEILCGDVLFLICGFDKQALNETRLPVYISHAPAGTSVKDIVHFAQMVESKKCAKFDYGSAEKNREKYGQDTPPEYDISRIETPVSLFWAQNDWLADPQDVQYIIKNVNTIQNNVYIPIWDHLDFIWATNTKPVLADKLVKIIKQDRNLH